VLEGVGGEVTQVDGSPIEYGKANILNPHFVASS
jgi:3'-phosphoadenosine 5'-phosphosulfate (PAPS) 3'-phosphatase